MKIYYNDNDRKIIQWLKQLVYDGLLPKGDVDDRDIREIKPSEIEGYDQVHLFAGIGGWAYGLQMADWPEGEQVWTGSCPCQPFSIAGGGEGTEDERHLWPAFRWLVSQCRPATIFGEQVASKDGREWLSGVRSDLEILGYEVGGADLCAAGVGTPQIRQRLWWVADSKSERWKRRVSRREDKEGKDKYGYSGCSSTIDWAKCIWWPCKDGVLRRVPARRMGDTECGTERGAYRRESGESRKGMSYKCKRSEIWNDIENNGDNDIENEGLEIEPSLFPLADGLPQRVGLLRGAGNAIIPQVASKFIKSYMERNNNNDT